MNKKNKTGPIKTKSSKDYQPFVKVADISSLGRSHRVFGHKTKRTHLTSAVKSVQLNLGDYSYAA